MFVEPGRAGQLRLVGPTNGHSAFTCEVLMNGKGFSLIVDISRHKCGQIMNYQF
ncbi:hypothetical protein SAMN06296036_102324 [Pseudobacteriovorax antillogorgiicola]|uniref:Uncharacterized protein n=2 Tax=Pseudobacteriovorax antillogorgiicola TaxID=1513793 RepID=A0A1Y6BBX9_9BACT|nr:hypothetical protein EDD56_102119 [Pseudobacteriovorax antillogorgiicola]SME96929.1 hypothetical protein SAMN06296036_102324 [Pseudobacteriovorax antillogorgiicola]